MEGKVVLHPAPPSHFHRYPYDQMSLFRFQLDIDDLKLDYTRYSLLDGILQSLFQQI